MLRPRRPAAVSPALSLFFSAVRTEVVCPAGKGEDFLKTIYFNGSILTMASPARVPAVLTDGRVILAVGEMRELTARAPRAKRFDLGGKTLMPAFVDAHSHFTQVAMTSAQPSLLEANSGEAVAAVIQGEIADHHIRRGKWVVAGDYDHNLLPGRRHPSLAELDAMAPDHPLMIRHRSGHSGLLNSRALAALGIRPDTPDPPGGKIGRDRSGLTGYLEENAFFAAEKRIPPPGAGELPAMIRRAQREYLSRGITTMQDALLVKEMIPLYRLLQLPGLLQTDLVAYPDAEAYPLVKKAFPGLFGQYRGHLRIGGIKIFLDGSPQARTAWMETPYAGGDGSCGYGTLTDGQVKSAMRTAAADRIQILAHCNGDAAAAQFLRCLREAEREFPVLKDLRPVIIHAQLMRPDQMDEAKQLGVYISFFAAHVWHWGDVHIANFGYERASCISAAASAAARGIPFTFHQDSPVIEPDMLETVWCAVNRRTKSGVLLGGNERLSAADALRAVTISAARQLGEEDSKGSIEPGKRADLVILSGDPLKVDPQRIRDLRVLQTIRAR